MSVLIACGKCGDKIDTRSDKRCCKCKDTTVVTDNGLIRIKYSGSVPPTHEIIKDDNGQRSETL